MRAVLRAGLHYLLRACMLCGALVADIGCFYTSIPLVVPISVCLYACVLTYGAGLQIVVTLLAIALLPLAVSISWSLFMVPLIVMTLVGFLLRSLLFTFWLLPYLLVALYAGVHYILAVTYPTALLLVPHLTVGSLLVILIVIKILSLTSLTHLRQGNRV